MMRNITTTQSWIVTCKYVTKLIEIQERVYWRVRKFTRKYILAQIDGFWRFTDATPCYVKESIENIGVTVMEPNPVKYKDSDV